LLTVSGTKINKATAEANNLECALVDYALILQAERANESHFQGCSLIPEYAIAVNPAEDMTIPLFLCEIHFNSLKLSLHEGVAVDEDVFGKFPEH
jgi:hypothetical protein